MKFKSLLAIGIGLATLGLSSSAWARPISDSGTIPSGPYPDPCAGPGGFHRCGGDYQPGGGRKHIPQVPRSSKIRQESPDPKLTTVPTYPTPTNNPIVNQPHR
jgi:hypothetical protein